jgi:hypothetical protein
MCPLWDAIDTPCLIRGFIAQAIYLYDETKKGSLTKPTGAGLNGKDTRWIVVTLLTHQNILVQATSGKYN